MHNFNLICPPAIRPPPPPLCPSSSFLHSTHNQLYLSSCHQNAAETPGSFHPSFTSSTLPVTLLPGTTAQLACVYAAVVMLCWLVWEALESRAWRVWLDSSVGMQLTPLSSQATTT